MTSKSEKSPASRPMSVLGRFRFITIAGLLLLAIAVGLISWRLLRANPPDVAGTTKSDKAASGTIQLAPRQLTYEVVNSYPHDPNAYLQGLVWYDNGFYESTGLYGRSTLRRVEFPSGRVVKSIDLASSLFGEGLALIGDNLIQLTWQAHRGFVYDRESFKLLREFSYDTEGWGLTYDGKNLILSDGSSDLTYLDPQTYEPLRKVQVTMNGRPITELNELEYIDGEIWANVWQTDLILLIDPASGQVKSFLNLKGILAPSDRKGTEDVLNGIAYDSEHKRIFVSGKLWPRLFEIRVK
ncbi:MAG TPA: glutaminyl-peptide cyclotransferase [Blastocatellia bacterium]|nr:glutaminyl-peptide cyclotransferase [Blastocatellia bacterium]